jgi:iron complex transport system ATP-binding protein
MKLELSSLCCGYQKEHPLVRDVNMTLEGGDICCILGPNGVGKTTLFKTILNLLPPLSGQVSIDGENIRRWSPKKRSEYLAYVAQAHIPAFPYRVKEVALMGRLGQTSALGQPTQKDYDIAEQALEDVGIRHLRDMVYTDISGGERQLLMIARALAQQPKVLIMDEPTANLDYGNMVLVMSCIRKLARQGLCVIFTSHMPDQAFYCEAKTALLLRNQPMIFGEASKVITEKNLYAAYETDIQILEVLTGAGKPIHVVSPRFRW